jgi:hypothetical protein
MICLVLPWASRAQPSSQTPDFLFGRPGVSIGVRGEWLLARTDSEIFDFTSDLLTLEGDAFDAPGIGVDLGLPIGSRLDALFGVDFTRASARSEYRDFTDTNDLPIEQQTELSELNLTGSVELALIRRGREIGQYAWISNAVIPYVGVGGGFLWYRFEQAGDFIDFLDLSIFSGRLLSSGWTPSAHVFGGADIKLTRRLYLSTEARYAWADAELKQDFVGFDRIDLSGLRITAGVQFAF